MNKCMLTALRELALLVGDGDLALTMLEIEARGTMDPLAARHRGAVVLRSVADRLNETAEYLASGGAAASDGDTRLTPQDIHHFRRIALAAQVTAGIAAALRKAHMRG